jgi:hypothetical protein
MGSLVTVAGLRRNAESRALYRPRRLAAMLATFPRSPSGAWA